MSSDKQNASKKREEPIENPDDKLDVVVDCDKSKVECICPTCGNRHIMNFHWLGRGLSWKYCQNCRDNI
jgi:hypothetical protein